MRLGHETTRISRQHRRIATLCDMVTEAVASGSLHNARLAFTRFRDAIEAHIAVEEQLFFPAVRGFRPELAEILTQLVTDHGSFCDKMEELHQLLAVGSAEPFRAGFAALQGEFVAHEAVEETLVAPSKGPES